MNMENEHNDVKLFPVADSGIPPQTLNSRSIENGLGNSQSYYSRDWKTQNNSRPQSLTYIIFNSEILPRSNKGKIMFGILISFILFISLFQGMAMSLILFICVGSLLFSRALVNWLLMQDAGDSEMRNIALAIREGSDSFFARVYGTIFRLSLPVSFFIFAIYIFRNTVGIHGTAKSIVSAIVTAMSFLLGAACSALAGYVGLWVSVRANVRVAASARDSYYGTIQIALRAGAIAALVVVTMVVLGISLLLLFFCALYQGAEGDVNAVPFSRIPLLLVGFGFGASFVAMFSQVGGGIFTKAADVGADLVGKLEKGIPEDDPRNPAVIADLVGDNVGDCSARGADLFESISAEIISTMILAGTLGNHCNMSANETRNFVLFPLLVHAFDLVVSSIGVLYIRGSSSDNMNAKHLEDPLAILKRGYKVSLIGSVLFFFLATKYMLYTSVAPNAWFHFFLCGFVGMVSAYVQLLITQYYTDYTYRPVRKIAEASTSGHATNVIAGMAVGLESVFFPVIFMCCSIIFSYYIGKSSGLKDSDGNPSGGIFGTAVATMGMLSTAVYVLAMDVFGPIADNAGGIVEMSSQPESVRSITDCLDAVGNTTKATTKGYAVGSTALASFLLLRAFLDEVSDLTGKSFLVVDIAQPEVFVGGFLGAAMVFRFASMAMSAVGESTQAVVEEVRRQFRTMPGILDGNERPQYGTCVDVVSRTALQKMTAPCLLVTLMPVSIGVVFRLLGNYIDDDLLGPKALASFIMFTTVSGICLGLFLNNAGGAWDNTKKLIETGSHGGKGSDAHNASITGDTVGDPAKDCAGPAMHVLIKLVANISMVLAPIFVGKYKS